QQITTAEHGRGPPEERCTEMENRVVTAAGKTKRGVSYGQTRAGHASQGGEARPPPPRTGCGGKLFIIAARRAGWGWQNGGNAKAAPPSGSVRRHRSAAQDDPERHPGDATGRHLDVALLDGQRQLAEDVADALPSLRQPGVVVVPFRFEGLQLLLLFRR